MLLANVYKYFATYRGEIAAEIVGEKEKNILDEWINVRTEELVDVVTTSLDKYDTVRATRAIQEYVDDLSTWYLRRSRKRKDAGFFTTMQESMLTVSRVMAPFMPFLAEALHGELAGANAPVSVHLEAWPKAEFSLSEKERKELTENMTAVRGLASAGLAARVAAGIKVRQPLASMTIAVKLSDELQAVLADEVNVKKILFDTDLKEPLLDTAITEELREEGTVRELTRMFQGLRQKAALKPADRIIAMAELPAAAKQAIEHNEQFFLSEIGATKIEYARSEKFEAEESGKLNGEDVWAALRKI